MMLIFRLLTSLQGSISLLFIFTLAIVMVLILPIYELAKLVLAGILVLFAFHYLNRDVWRISPSSFVEMRLDGDEVVLIRQSGEEIKGRVEGNSFVTPLLTILNIRPQESRWLSSVVIFPDSMTKEDFRQLRVLLKWRRDAVL